MNPGLYHFYPDHNGRYPGQGKNATQAQKRNRMLVGLLAGAAVAYVVSNKKVRSYIAATGASAASAARGELEELKERLADSEAELEYLRSQMKEE